MKKAQKRLVSALAGVASAATMLVPAATVLAQGQSALDDAKAKVDYAKQTLAFVDFNKAFGAVLALPQDQQWTLLAELAKIESTVKTPDIMNVLKTMDDLVNQKDLANYYKLYDMIEDTVTLQANKDYLMGELTSWGYGIVFTSDVVAATDAVIKVWDTKSMDDVKVAQYAINAVRNTGSKAWVQNELTKAKAQVRTLSLSAADSTLKADGYSQTLVTLKVTDGLGNVLPVSDIEVQFSANFGSFAEDRVIVEKGVATVMYKSQQLDTAHVADISAKVSESLDTGLIGLTSNTLSVVLDPRPSGQTGVIMTGAETGTADRVTLYFDKNVTPSDFMKTLADGSKVVDDTKCTVEVFTAGLNDTVPGDEVSTTNPAGFGAKREVEAFLPVQGDSKALVALLKVNYNSRGDKGVLVDNANVRVNFTDLRSEVKPKNTKEFIFNDTRIPVFLSVKPSTTSPTQARSITLTFSEAVNDNIIPLFNGALIDGVQLGNDKWGVAGSRANMVLGTYDEKTGVDHRNEITINLGKDKDGEQLYFKSGGHSVQIVNFGDWAQLTDTDNNLEKTAKSADFNIPVDTSRPQATVQVESPEQWKVTFDKPITELTNGGHIPGIVNTGKAAQEQYIKSVLRLEFLHQYTADYSKWETLNADNNPTLKGNTTLTANDFANLLKITKINEKQFLVELNYDWSAIYNTNKTGKTYYNDQFQLAIDYNKVTNDENGLLNNPIALQLNDAIMKKADDVSPSVVEAKYDAVNSVVTVKMSEPVKIPTGEKSANGLEWIYRDSAGNIVNSEPITFAQNEQALQVVTATFVKADGSETVFGKITEQYGDVEDYTVKVVPNKALSTGTWNVIVNNAITDDVGNHVSSTTKSFEVTAAPVPFKVEKITHYVKVGFPQLYDLIVVDYTKDVAQFGGAANALNPTNYTIDNYNLPAGSRIELGDGDNTNNGGVAEQDKITIYVPDAALYLNDASTTVSVSGSIQAKDGSALVNPGQYKINYDITDGSYK